MNRSDANELELGQETNMNAWLCNTLLLAQHFQPRDEWTTTFFGLDPDRVLLQARKPRGFPNSFALIAVHAMRRADVDHQLQPAVGQDGFAKWRERAFHLPILLDDSGELGGVGAPKMPLTCRGLKRDFVDRTRSHRNKVSGIAARSAARER